MADIWRCDDPLIEETAMTTATTTHLPALDDDPVVRADALALLGRMVEHYRASTTDLAPSVRPQPADAYCDPELWRRELDAVHRRVPLPLALSCELVGPGAYKATEVAGTPVLLTRDAAGEVHAVLNSCRHRGAELLPVGTGTAPRLVCPYHSWCYDLAGRLEVVEDERLFGDVDRAQLDLVALPVVERAGLVFVGLTPGARLDLDGWLGAELGHLLDALDLGSCSHHSRRDLAGPNWKVVLDGYLESYHVGTAHRDSVLLTVVSDMATFDSYGPHMRSGFALRSIAGIADRPVEDSADACAENSAAALLAGVSAVYWLFPGLNISGGWGSTVAVSLVLPGRTWDGSHTEQHILLRSAPVDDEGRRAADRNADRLREIVLDEDYSVAEGVQRGLGAAAGRQFLFGRNEPGVQHFHDTLARLVGTAAPAC